MDSSDKHLLAKIGQYVLITNHTNQVLLLQRVRSKAWSLPGGRLNKRETDWKEALIREVKEETGMTVENLKPFDIALIEDPYQIKYCVYFLASCQNPNNTKLSQEHISFQWIDESKLKECVIDDEPKVREVLKKYFK